MLPHARAGRCDTPLLERRGPRTWFGGPYDALLTEDMLKSPTRQVGIADRVK